MLPLFVGFLVIVLWLAASAVNLSVIVLQQQRLQSQSDQEALTNHQRLNLAPGQTFELEKCSVFELPIKLTALPETQKICVRSAAR
jgi:hypothetical protein